MGGSADLPDSPFRIDRDAHAAVSLSDLYSGSRGAAATGATLACLER